MISRTSQEFNTGAQLYVGGLEAAKEVLEGENVGGVKVVIDCRSNQYAGRRRAAAIFCPPGPKRALKPYTLNHKP